MLTHAESRRVYDRLGPRLDTQSFYENPAMEELLGQLDVATARRVLEFGCGTGRLAERLLREQLPADCHYEAVDSSPVMVRLARDRLAPWADRARVRLTDGGICFAGPDATYDCVLSTYVADLLSDGDINTLAAEAHRTLAPDGALALISLTFGATPLSRLVSGIWQVLHRLRPALVGGCRPVALVERLDERRWTVTHRKVVSAWGVSSEILIAVPR